MTKNKKVISIVIAVAMTLSLVMSAFALPTESLEPAKHSYYFDEFSVADIEKHPEVKMFLDESNFEEATYKSVIENEKKRYVEKVNQYLQEAGIEPATEEQIDATNQKYNLESMAEDYLRNAADDNRILVRYDTNNGVKGISNVWFIQYFTTDTGFSMKIANVGKDPIDKISGRVTWYKMDGKNWVTNAGNTSAFTKKCT